MAKQENTGGLWPNKFKGVGDKRPDFTGDININGVTHKIAGWRTDGAHGKPIVALRVEQQPKPTPARWPELDDSWESDIPF